MLKYSKGQKISLNITLINNDGKPESDATINYKLYNGSNTLEVSGNDISYNEQLGSYIDIIDPSTDWNNQQEGVYYIVWEISKTTEDYPEVVTEELHIHDYDYKLDRILGLVHENVTIIDPIYDKWDNLVSATMRLYSDSNSVGTENNILDEYKITAESEHVGKFKFWKQERIK